MESFFPFLSIDAINDGLGIFSWYHNLQHKPIVLHSLMQFRKQREKNGFYLCLRISKGVRLFACESVHVPDTQAQTHTHTHTRFWTLELSNMFSDWGRCCLRRGCWCRSQIRVNFKQAANLSTEPQHFQSALLCFVFNYLQQKIYLFPT